MNYKKQMDLIKKAVDPQMFYVAVFFTPPGAKPELTFNLAGMGKKNRFFFKAFIKKLIEIKKLEPIPEFPDKDVWYFRYSAPMDESNRLQAYNEFYFATKRDHPEYDIMYYADFVKQNGLKIEKGVRLSKTQ